MSTLTLIRHSQARPFEKDGDRLSPTGEQQARLLGEYWVKRSIRFDRVLMGSLRRHRRTYALAAAVCEAYGLPMPLAETTPDWNEYDTNGLFENLAPELARQDSGFRQLQQAFESAAPDERNRYFQKMMEVLMGEWQAGRTRGAAVESYLDFRNRVRGALAQLQASETSRRVAVFTSGGPIGLCVQTSLDAPDKRFLDINWRVKNCSLTEFMFTRERISLDSFNALPHLDGELVTFR